MSQTTKKHLPQKMSVLRRRFLSTALIGGASVALARSTGAMPATSTADPVPDVLPSPADSLSLYIGFLDRLQSEILHGYFEVVGCLAGEVRNRYEQLRADVAELERLVPQLRTRGETSNLKRATDVGHASASNIRSLAQDGVVLNDGNFMLISFTSKDLSNSLEELESQGGSLKLTPRAAELLRKILQEIRDLNKPTEGLRDTSKVLTDVDNDLKRRVGEIRTSLNSAISRLVADDFTTGPASTLRQDQAKQLVQDAIQKLQPLDSYTPPQSVSNFMASSSSSSCQTISRVSRDSVKPTQTLRELLEGTLKWIDSGVRLGLNSSNQDVSFVRAVMSDSAPVVSGLGLWFGIRRVLSEELPEPGRLRTTVCLGLIFPILIGGFAEAEREDKIYRLIPNIHPSGALDSIDQSRRRAAHRLAALSL